MREGYLRKATSISAYKRDSSRRGLAIERTDARVGELRRERGQSRVPEPPAGMTAQKSSIEVMARNGSRVAPNARAHVPIRQGAAGHVQAFGATRLRRRGVWGHSTAPAGAFGATRLRRRGVWGHSMVRRCRGGVCRTARPRRSRTPLRQAGC